MAARRDTHARHGGACHFAWVGLLLFAAVLAMAGCADDDPEASLRETIAQMQAALEARDAAALQQHLADDFIGNDGLDKAGARRLAAAYLLRHREVGVAVGPLDVELRDGHATVRFTAMLHGGAGGLLPDAAQVQDVETGWRRSGARWQLVSARWKPKL